MRILFNNLIDGLAASRLSALTEDPLYEASRVQDQRLTTRWHTTAATDQTIIFSGSCDTIVGGNIGLVTGSSATNLITSANMAGWSIVGATAATASSIVGQNAYSVTAATAGSSYTQSPSISAIATTYSTSIVVRKDTSTTGLVQVIDSTSAVSVMTAPIDFSAKTVTYSVGSECIPPQWIDDQTVRIFVKTANINITSAHNIYFALHSANGTHATGASTIYSMPLIINNTFPVPYIATSRSAIDTSYSFRIPPSGKFIVDCDVFPFRSYDVSGNMYFASWYSSAPARLYIGYDATTDKIVTVWQDGGTTRILYSPQTFSAASVINSRQRIVVSADIGDARATTGSIMFVNGVLSDAEWSGIPDALVTTTFSTLEVGLYNNVGFTDAIFRHVKVYGGCFTSAQSTITTEAEIDAALAKHTLLFDQTYQRQFNFDTVAILGHNISEGAAVKMEANDFPEWNYVDGSGSSIIQHALSWDDETILKMITATKKQYVKFTINDPNNDDGILKIGRFWIGRYLDIDPASLDNFTVIKKRTDDVAYGVNMQRFAAVGTGYREFDFKFPPTNSTMVTAIQTMYNAVGNHSSVIFCNFNTIRDYELVEPVYCSIVGDVSFSHQGRQRYEYSLKLQENK